MLAPVIVSALAHCQQVCCFPSRLCMIASQSTAESLSSRYALDLSLSNCIVLCESALLLSATRLMNEVLDCDNVDCKLPAVHTYGRQCLDVETTHECTETKYMC